MHILDGFFTKKDRPLSWEWTLNVIYLGLYERERRKEKGPGALIFGRFYIQCQCHCTRPQNVRLHIGNRIPSSIKNRCNSAAAQTFSSLSLITMDPDKCFNFKRSELLPCALAVLVERG